MYNTSVLMLWVVQETGVWFFLLCSFISMGVCLAESSFSNSSL